MNRGGSDHQAASTEPGIYDEHRLGLDQARRRKRRRRRRLPTVKETSAGGLVVDAAGGHALLIRKADRKGRLLWTLPKGHVIAGESLWQTAVREIAEETGIVARIVAPIGKVSYRFTDDERYIHKTVHQFLLDAVGGALSTADREVLEVAWKPLAGLDDLLAHADERRIVRRALELLATPSAPDAMPDTGAGESAATVHGGTEPA